MQSQTKTLGSCSQENTPDDDSPFYFDEYEADRWVAFLEEYCSLVDAKEGEKPEVMDWHKNLVRNLFGWKRKADGLRRYRFAFVFVPRKNSKTWIGSCISIGLASIDGERAAQVYQCAASEEQAKVCFEMAVTQLKNARDAEDLEEEGDQQHRRDFGDQFIWTAPDKKQKGGYIKHVPSNSKVIPLSGKAGAKTGYNPHGVIYDEYHEAKDDRLEQVLKTGMINRTQPIVIYITTAGDDAASPCGIMLDYCRKIRDGVLVRDDFYVEIYEPPESVSDRDLLENEEYWPAINPGWGVTVNAEVLRSIVADARGNPTKEKSVLQFHFNRFVSRGTTLIPLPDWDACGADYNEADLYGRECYGGLDLASVLDTNSLVLGFPEWKLTEREVEIYNELGVVVDKETHMVNELWLDLLAWFWVPEQTIHNRRDQGYCYDLWVEQGLMRRTKGSAVDFDQMLDDIRRITGNFRCHEIGYDPYQAYDLTRKLAAGDPAKNIDPISMIEVRAGFLSLSPATKELQTLALHRRLRHNKHAVLRWNVSNGKAVEDGKENIQLSKKESTQKIDGLAAAVNMMSRVITAAPQSNLGADVW